MFLFAQHDCLKFFWVNYHFIFLEPTSNSDYKVYFNSISVFAAADKELPSAKLCIDAPEAKITNYLSKK